MDSIKNRLMKRCIEMLAEIANTPSDGFFGTPPKTFFIDFAFGDGRTVGMFIRKPLETYKYKSGAVVKVNTGTKNQTEPISGMYYSEGYSAIGIDKKQNLAFLSFIVGPRYGRGFQYEILDSEEGKVLGEEQLTWVS